MCCCGLLSFVFRNCPWLAFVVSWGFVLVGLCSGWFVLLLVCGKLGLCYCFFVVELVLLWLVCSKSEWGYSLFVVK